MGTWKDIERAVKRLKKRNKLHEKLMDRVLDEIPELEYFLFNTLTEANVLSYTKARELTKAISDLILDFSKRVLT